MSEEDTSSGEEHEHEEHDHKDHDHKEPHDQHDHKDQEHKEHPHKESHQDDKSKEEHHKEKSSHSRALKIKKFFATKTAGSAAGRKAVNHFLGPNGAELLHALESAAAKDVGEKKAKYFIKAIFKLAFKAKILHDEKLILPEERARFVEPVNALAVAAYQILKVDTETKIDITAISLKFAQLEQMVVELLKKHIKQKNVDMASEVLKYFGGTGFLEQFLTSPKMAPEKQAFAKNLQIVMKARLAEAELLPPQPKCAHKACGQDSLPADELGTFAGSAYCLSHHREQMEFLIRQPSVVHFITENGKNYQPVRELLEKQLPLPEVQFVLAASNYAACNDAVRRIFAEELFDKYLSEKARMRVTCLSGEILAPIQQGLSEARSKRELPSATLYDGARSAVVEALQPAFQEHIVPSDAFQKYVRTRTLPSE